MEADLPGQLYEIQWLHRHRMSERCETGRDLYATQHLVTGLRATTRQSFEIRRSVLLDLVIVQPAGLHALTHRSYSDLVGDITAHRGLTPLQIIFTDSHPPPSPHAAAGG
jgi:hypothetical protein